MLGQSGWLAWLLAPISGASHHSIGMAASWHGRSMVLAWAILAPVGILVARYFKVVPGQDWPRRLDNRLWWNWHRGCQYAAVALTLASAVLAVRIAQGATSIARAHGLIGWLVVGLACAQVLAGWLRGTKGGPTDPDPVTGDRHGDHYDMTSRRLAFEYFHKFSGLLTLAAAMAAIGLGLVVADAPRWMAAVIASWWALLAGLAAFWQSRGRCIDTYQAIWGTDPAHPGNGRRPIGWGVRTVSPKGDRAAAGRGNGKDEDR